MVFQEQLSMLKEKKVGGFSALHVAVACVVLILCVCVGGGAYVMSKKGSGVCGSGIVGKVCGMMKKSTGQGQPSLDGAAENHVIEGLTAGGKKKKEASIAEELLKDAIIY